MATATTGAVIGVNPFDEPNVSESKQDTNDLLREWKQKGAFSEGSPVIADERLEIYCDQGARWFFEGNRGSVRNFINAFLGLARSQDYLALLPYFVPTPERDRLLASIRSAQRAVARGSQPRWDTGHATCIPPDNYIKVGPDWGVFIMLTADARDDLPIPGEDYGFAVLQRAQALGDFRSLHTKGRRVIRVHFGSDADRGLNQPGRIGEDVDCQAIDECDECPTTALIPQHSNVFCRTLRRSVGFTYIDTGSRCQGSTALISHLQTPQCDTSGSILPWHGMEFA